MKLFVIIYFIVISVLLILGVCSFVFSTHPWIMWVFLVLLFSTWPTLCLGTLAVYSYFKFYSKENDDACILRQHDNQND